jgi:hypothetical protein
MLEMSEVFDIVWKAGLVNLGTGHRFSGPKVIDANQEITEGKTRKKDAKCFTVCFESNLPACAWLNILQPGSSFPSRNS